MKLNMFVTFFSWCVFEGKTTREIAQLLENQKVISPAISTINQKKKKGMPRKINNDYFWRNESIKAILSNEIYTGEFWFGKTKNRQPVPRDKWILSQHRIPRIIEDKVFYEAQKKLKDSANKVLLNVKREDDRLYLLSGLLKCGWCQKHTRSHEANTWTGNRKEVTKMKDDFSYYYKCGHKNTRKYDQLCPTIPIPAEQLESYVIAFIKKLLSNPKSAFEHQQQLKSNQTQIRLLRKERDELIKNFNNLPKRRENLSLQHENGIINNAQLISRDQDIKKESKDLSIRLKEIDAILGEQEMSEGYIKSFNEYAKRYSNALDDVTKNKNEIYILIHSLIDTIMVYSRTYDPDVDRIAGRKKDNQQIPNSILIKLKLPKDLLSEIMNQHIQHISEFAVTTDTMSVKGFEQELTSDYIIPAEYYDTHRLVFSHYQIDRIIVRIGRNGKQKNKDIRFASRNRCFGPISQAWNCVDVPREGNRLPQLPTSGGQISVSQHLLN